MKTTRDFHSRKNKILVFFPKKMSFLGSTVQDERIFLHTHTRYGPAQIKKCGLNRYGASCCSSEPCQV